MGEKLKYSLEIEVEGRRGQLSDFLHQLKPERPRAAVVKTEEVLEIDPSGATRFEIRSSQAVGSKTAAVLLVAWESQHPLLNDHELNRGECDCVQR